MIKAAHKNIKQDNTYITPTFAKLQWKFTFYIAQLATRFVSCIHICSLRSLRYARDTNMNLKNQDLVSYSSQYWWPLISVKCSVHYGLKQALLHLFLLYFVLHYCLHKWHLCCEWWARVICFTANCDETSFYFLFKFLFTCGDFQWDEISQTTKVRKV